ncbi:MAG: IS256 family transposase [Nitrososphaeraceae archaeon]
MDKIDLKELAKTFKTAREVQDFVKEITKGMLENILQEELNQHLGYEKHEAKNSGNSRNGFSSKKLRSTSGEFDLQVPRDRNGLFKPIIVKPYQNDISDFDQKIISMYARGMTTRDIQAHIEDIYGAEISPAMVSMITDKVMAVAHTWQQRPLESVYPIVFFDALFFKVRENGKIISKAAYSCLGIDSNGRKDVLGIWIAQTESATHWLQIMNELKSRGVTDIFIACIDGLSGLDKSIEAIFPKTEIQRCVIHLMRNSFKYIPHKHKVEFIANLKPVYTALNEEYAYEALMQLKAKWESRYPLAIKPWIDNWTQVSTYFKYPEEIRRTIYTTNAVESLHRQFRKVTKNRSKLSNDESLYKILFLAVRNITKNWSHVVRDWPTIAAQLHIMFQERFTVD